MEIIRQEVEISLFLRWVTFIRQGIITLLGTTCPKSLLYRNKILPIIPLIFPLWSPRDKLQPIIINNHPFQTEENFFLKEQIEQKIISIITIQIWWWLVITLNNNKIIIWIQINRVYLLDSKPYNRTEYLNSHKYKFPILII